MHPAAAIVYKPLVAAVNHQPWSSLNIPEHYWFIRKKKQKTLITTLIHVNIPFLTSSIHHLADHHAYPADHQCVPLWPGWVSWRRPWPGAALQPSWKTPQGDCDARPWRWAQVGVGTMEPTRYQPNQLKYFEVLGSWVVGLEHVRTCWNYW